MLSVRNCTDQLIIIRAGGRYPLPAGCFELVPNEYQYKLDPLVRAGLIEVESLAEPIAEPVVIPVIPSTSDEPTVRKATKKASKRKGT